MTLTKIELQRFADELPIGYYANTRLTVTIDDKADTSYFMPTTREIFISLKGINASIKGMRAQDETTKERAVRAHLYHELSHAILTPREMKNNDIRNVFEDERIETLLRTYYHKVDFRENIKALCNYHGEKPKDAWEKFYYAVRFRLATPEILEAIDKVIKKWSHLNWNSASNNWDTELQYYYSDIEDIYILTAQENYSDTQWNDLLQNLSNFGENGGESNIPNEYAEGCGVEENPNAENGGEGMGTAGEGENENSEGEEYGHGCSHNNPFERAIDQAIANSYDTELYMALEPILQSFAKKNAKGSSLQAYSGRINPRNCAREDYRYFDRKATVNGSNPYGTFHLNLFIDNSGSFSNNQVHANKIIATLCRLEERYNFFTVDFAFCGDEVVHKTHNQLYLTADEGTSIPKSARGVFKSMQKKNTCVYNLVLYDGNAWYDRSAYNYCYEAFDTTNTTLILDMSCRADSSHIQNAKVILSRNYLNALNKNIISTLRQAVR